MPRSSATAMPADSWPRCWERVEPVVHEVGDRFPGAQTPHASRGWSTPKLILPKRGVWERHADANRFRAADTNSGLVLR
jgi:hypothetical protein